MSEDYTGIKLQIVLPTEAHVSEKIKELQKIVSKHKLDVGLNISPQAIQGLERLSKMSNDVAKQMNNIKAPHFDFANPSKETQFYLDRINSLVGGLKRFNSEVKYTYDEMGRVNLQVKNAEGLLKKYTLQWDAARNVLKKVNRQDSNSIGKDTLDLFKSNYTDVKIPALEGLYKSHVDKSGLAELQKRIQQLNIATPNLQKELKLIDQSFRSLQTNAKLTAKEMGMLHSHSINFAEAFKTAMIKFPIWMGASTLFFQSFGFLQNGIQYIRDLDSAMVDLQKVTNETAETYKNFEAEASELGLSLARTSVEVVKATANFARMGYSLQESKELAETALMMQNVGDIKNVDDATKHLIGTLKGFNMQASDSMSILDLMNNVSNKHSITVDGLGKAYERSAAVMAQAGNTIEQATALYTGANAAIQNPEKVSNGFKTIALRLRGVSEEGDLLFGKLEKDLDNIGVKLRNEVNGEFRSTYDVLKDLSKVYKDLDPLTSAKLLEDIAGKYQANVLTSTLSNFAEAEQTLQDALNSTGSAAQENEKYLNSVEAKVQAFKVRMEELYKTFFSSDLLKGFLSIAEGVVGVLTKITDVFGGIPTIAGLATASILIFNTSIRASIANFISAKVVSQGFLNPLPALFGLASAGATTFSGALTALRAGMISANVSAIALQATLTLGLSLAITGVTIGITKLIEGYNQGSQATADFVKNTNEAIQTLNQEVTQIESLLAQYNKLSQSPLAEDKEKLLQVQRQIAQVLPQTATGFDNEGNAIATDTSLVLENIKAKKNLIAENQNLLKAEFSASYEDKLKERKDLLKEMKTYQENYNAAIERSEQAGLKGDKSGQKEALELAKRHKESLNELKGEVDLVTKDIDSMSLAVINTDAKMAKWNDGIKNKLLKSIHDLGKSESQTKKFIESLGNSDFANEVDSFINSFSKLSQSGEDSDKKMELYSQSIERIGKITGASKEEIKIFTELFRNMFPPESIENVKNSANALEQYAMTQDQLMKSFDDLSNTIADFNNILYDLSNGKKLTSKATMDLVQKYPALINALKIERGNVIINKEAIEQLRSAKLNEFQASVAAQNGMTAAQSSALRTRLANYGIELEAIQTVADAQNAIAKAAKQTTGGYSDAGIRNGVVTSLSNQMAPLVNVLKNKATIDKLMGMVSSSNYGVNIPSGGGGGGSKGSGGTKSFENQLETYVSMIKQAKNEYNELIKLANRKYDLGIIDTDQKSEEYLKARESYVNKLFTLESDLTKKILELQAKRNDYKKSSKQYKQIDKLIGKYKSDLKALPALQETATKEWQRQLTATENKFKEFIKLLRNAQLEYGRLIKVADRRAKLGLTDTMGKLEEKFQAREQYISQLFDLEKSIEEKIAEYQTKQSKVAKNTKEWWSLRKLIQQYTIDLKNVQKQQVLSTAQWEKQQSAIERITKMTESWRERITTTVEKIKEIGTAFKDSVEDIALRGNLNKQFNTDIFGSSEDLFSSTLEAYKTEILEYSKSFDMIMKTKNDKLKTLQTLSAKLANGTIIDSEKILLENLQNSESVQGALKEFGLTVADVTRKNKEFVHIIKQYEKFQKAVEQVDNLKDSIKSLSDEYKNLKLDEQFEKLFNDNYKRFYDSMEEQPKTPLDSLNKQLEDATQLFNDLLEKSKTFEKMKFTAQTEGLDKVKEMAKDLIVTTMQGFDGSQYKGLLNSFADIWDGTQFGVDKLKERASGLYQLLAGTPDLKQFSSAFEKQIKIIENAKVKITQTTDEKVKQQLRDQATAARTELKKLVNEIVKTQVKLIDSPDVDAINEAIESASSLEEVMKLINSDLLANNTELEKMPGIIDNLKKEIEKANKELEVTQKLRDVFSNIFSFDNLWVEKKDEFGNVVKGLNDQVVKTLQQSSELVDQIFEQVKNKLSDSMLSMLTDNEGFISKLLDGSGISDAFTQTFTGLEDKFANTLSGLGSQASSYFSTSFQSDILKGMGNLDSVLGELMSASLNAIPTVVSDVLETLPNMFLQLTNSMSTGVINSLSTILNKAIETISSALRVDIPLLDMIQPTVNKIENTETQVFNASSPTSITYAYNINGILLYREGALRELAYAIKDVLTSDEDSKW